MTSRQVPVSHGSAESVTAMAGTCLVTHARFPPDALLDMHVHDRPTFAIMLEGSFDLVFRGHTFACTPASVSTEPAGERHANRINHRGADVLVLQPDTVSDMWRPFRRLLDSAAEFPDGRIRSLGGRLADEVAQSDPFTPLVVQALALEAMVLAARLRPGRRRSTGTPAWLLRTKAMLHEEEPGRLDMEHLARSAGVSSAHLARAFRQHFGVSIGVYARRVRLERAARLLRTSGDGIAAIAARTGFADQSHLTRAFTRHFHVSPHRFRTGGGRVGET
jgi:AraC family transcriptional regulator